MLVGHETEKFGPKSVNGTETLSTLVNGDVDGGNKIEPTGDENRNSNTTQKAGMGDMVRNSIRPFAIPNIYFLFPFLSNCLLSYMKKRFLTFIIFELQYCTIELLFNIYTT